MGPVSIGVEVQRNTDGDTPSRLSHPNQLAEKYTFHCFTGVEKKKDLWCSFLLSGRNLELFQHKNGFQ